MNLEARLHPKRTDWNACHMQQRYISGCISRGNNLHFVFFIARHLISINLRSVANDSKADGLFIYFPSSRFSCSPHNKSKHGPSWWQKQALNCLRFHWLIPLPWGGDYHPRAIFHKTHDSFTLVHSKSPTKLESRGKSPKQPLFTSSWDYSMTEQRTEEGGEWNLIIL